GHPAAGRALRALVRGADRDARPEVRLPGQLLEATGYIRLSTVVALRRDGLRGRVRRRRDSERARLPRRRHGRLLRGDHRHGLARAHHAPGVHARLCEALVRVRARAPDREHHRPRPLRPLIDKYYQAAGAEAERRIRLFRLAWDYLGSDLGGRGELYERFYLSDSYRMTALAYTIADKTFPESLVEQFLQDPA